MFNIDSVDSRPINIKFAISDKRGVDIDTARFWERFGEILKDATSVLGEVKIICGQSSECFHLNQKLVNMLNGNLKGFTFVDSAVKFRRIDGLYFDASEANNKSLIVPRWICR